MTDDTSELMQLNDLRLRVLNKDPITPQEMAAIIGDLRQGRVKALREERSTTRKSKAALKKVPELNEPASQVLDLDKLFS